MHSLTPEQVRFHAAGHLAAAHALARAGQAEAAGVVLAEVQAYARHPKVSAPEAVHTMLAAALAAPARALFEIERLEAWFVHPMNTLIETSGANL